MFDMRQEDAAKSLGICVSTLKHACRQLGIPRWPFKNASRASRPATSSCKEDASFTSARLDQVRYSAALHAVRTDSSSGKRLEEGQVERCSAALHAVRAIHLSGECEEEGPIEHAECEEEGPIEHASVRLPRPVWHEIWRRSNLNNNGLLDEAMDTI